MGLFLCLFLALPCYFGMRYLLYWIGIHEDIVENSMLLILLLAPGNLLRLINDNTKAVLQAQGLINKVGVFSFVNMVFFCIYSPMLMIYADLGILGYGLCMLIYEGVGILFQAIMCFFLADRRSFDSEIPILTKIGWISFECFKNSLTIILSSWAFDYYLFLLSFLHSKAQTSLYTLNYSITMAFCQNSSSIINYPRIVINYLLAHKEFDKVKKSYLKLGFYVVLVCIGLIAIVGLISAGMSYLIVSNTIDELWELFPTLSSVLLITVFDQWNRAIMVAFEKKCEAISASLIFCGLGRIVIGYFLVYYFGYGVVGVNISDTICLSMRSIVYLFYIMTCDFKDFKGIKQN